MQALAAMPLTVAAAVRVVLTDIDDTLTTEGRLPADAYAALERLEQAGIQVVPITGRPAGWCDHIARMWPVRAVVGENGAFYYAYDRQARRMTTHYWTDAASRQASRKQLGAIRDIVDATAPYACSFKPQIAYFAAHRAEDQLEALCQHIRDKHPDLPIVLDAKRGDIGSTAENYAREAYERYQAHALTVSPYMGLDSVEPYLAWRDRGVIVLCRTSNPGGSDLQFLKMDNGEPLYLHVAGLVADKWNANGQCGLVVGATFPNELAAVRQRIGDALPLLVPGIGAQGGDITATVNAGANAARSGMMINSSRAIIYASGGDDWREAAGRAAMGLRDAINAVR